MLFRNRPMLAPELLREVLGIALPEFREARIEAAELTEVVPTEYRADLVVLLRDGKPVYAIVVEVQLRRDESKRKTWPLYLTSLRSRVECPTALLVVAPDASVARWCARPIALGHPGFALRPLVMGPDAVPVITDAKRAREEPELAVLSVMSHGEEEAAFRIGKAALSGARGLEDDRLRLYSDLVMASLGKAARSALEKLMESGTYQYQSDFARKYVAQGRQEGLEEGRHAGEAAALLEVLRARGLKVSVRDRRRIQSCVDSEQLRSWLRAAVHVQATAELFGASSQKGRRAPARSRGAPAGRKR